LLDRIDIQHRSLFSKLKGILQSRSVDRTTPAAIDYLPSTATSNPLVYVNGELAGRVVPFAKKLGLQSIFICQNFAPEYLRAVLSSLSLPRPFYARLTSVAALPAYREAGVCQTPTAEGRAASASASSRAAPAEIADSHCYFGHND